VSRLADEPKKLRKEAIEMAATNINRVVLTGNLTADPELRSLPSGTSVCKLRVACNTRKKDGSTGEWTDKPNFFDVTVWGAQGENCSRYLSKGRPVAIDGRLEWREWETPEGHKRQAIDIIADSVQFLGGREEGSGGGQSSAGFAPRSDIPVDTSDYAAAPAGGNGGGGAPSPAEDDIPF
jgi:single-strand DNA-binding protein